MFAMDLDTEQYPARHWHRLPDGLIEELIRDAEACPGRSAHDALAAALAKRLQTQGIDFETARRLFTLVCVLHQRI